MQIPISGLLNEATKIPQILRFHQKYNPPNQNITHPLNHCQNLEERLELVLIKTRP